MKCVQNGCSLEGPQPEKILLLLSHSSAPKSKFNMNLRIGNSKMVPSTVSEIADIMSFNIHFRIVAASEMFGFYVFSSKCKILQTSKKLKISSSCSRLKRILFGLDVGCPVWFDTWHQRTNCVVWLRPWRKRPTSELSPAKVKLNGLLPNKGLHQNSQHESLPQNLKCSYMNEQPASVSGSVSKPIYKYGVSLYQMRHCLSQLNGFNI